VYLPHDTGLIRYSTLAPSVGTNPAATRQGRSFYDTAEAADALTTWQQVLRSEEMRRYNFMDLDRNNDGFLEHDDLRRAFGEGGSRSYLHHRHRALHPNPSTSNPYPRIYCNKRSPQTWRLIGLLFSADHRICPY